jgi:glycosidase
MFVLSYLHHLFTLVDSLATESEYVRGKLAGYANDLLSLGVDGFRIDAAKRMFTVGLLVSTVLTSI